MVGHTDTFVSGSPLDGTRAVDWVLIAALDCERLTAPPVRVDLADCREVEIGRGATREIKLDNGHARIAIVDRWASLQHARLVREEAGWTVHDAGSKNGTRINGERVTSAPLADGDVLEVGGTFLILRRCGSVLPHEQRDEPLETMSPAFERELAVLRKVARSRVPVLVLGESGTGKEVISRAVHALSGRRGPLVPVNCGAIPAALVESELFGSRRGAFSGAEDRTGLVRGADQGTLFLDEVVELPVASQAAMLRFLQDGEVAPLGADKRVVVDARLVAATNQAVDELVASGRFRRDLYARLCGYMIHLPPLRARLEDLGLLIARLLVRLEPDGRPRKLSRAAARALFLHRWPHNVRELEQVLRSALATATDEEIGVDDLRLVAEAPAAAPHEAREASPRDQLMTLLDKHAGNLTAVARELATSRSQVRRLLVRHGLASEAFKRR